jgi:recombination associated protein RdgC
MPIRRGSVSFARFRLGGTPPRDVRRWLTSALRSGSFEPIDVKGDLDRAAGFVELEAAEMTAFTPSTVFTGTAAVFAWRVDRLRAPGAQLRGELARWSQAFEAANKRPPGRQEKADQKDVLKRAWRSRAEPVSRTFDVSLDLTSRELLVWATSASVVEEIHAALEERLGLPLPRSVPSASIPAARLDALAPTPALFPEAA